MALESVLITGTTSGIGRALLDHYARRGAHVISVNRRRVPELEARYPSVRFECVDVRSADDVAELVGSLAASAELPEIFVLNAGINRIDKVRIKNAFSASPDAAARAISRFARTRRRKLFYPRRAVPLYFGAWLCRSVLPGFFRGQETLAGNARRARGFRQATRKDG